MGRFMPRRTEHRTENTPPISECAWPLPAHPLLSGVFPLCGMTLRPSEGGTMLAAILYPDARAAYIATEPVPFAPASGRAAR